MKKSKKAKTQALREKHVKDMRTLEILNGEMLVMAGYTAQDVSNINVQQLKEKDMEELIRKKIPAAPDVCPNCGIVLNREVSRTP